MDTRSRQPRALPTMTHETDLPSLEPLVAPADGGLQEPTRRADLTKGVRFWLTVAQDVEYATAYAASSARVATATLVDRRPHPRGRRLRAASGRGPPGRFADSGRRVV